MNRIRKIKSTKLFGLLDFSSRDSVVLTLIGLNGLILTTAVCLVINMFVNELLGNEKKQFQLYGQSELTHAAGKIEGALGRAASIIKMDGIDNIKKEHVNLLEDSEVRFALLAFIEKDFSEASMVRVSSGQNGSTDQITDKMLYSVLKKKEANFPRQDQRLKIILDDALFPLYRRSDGAGVGRDIMVVVPIERGGRLDRSGYLIGIVALNQSTLFLDISRLHNVIRADLVENTNKNYIYRASRINDREVSSVPDFAFTVSFAGINADLIGVFDQSSEKSLVRSLPWISLLFGYTITLVSLIFIRRSRAAAQSLALANIALERKNVEMSQGLTERERLNQTLKKSERENRAIMNAISETIFEIALSGEILFLSEPWKKLTGMNVEDMIGKNIFDLIHPKDQDEQRKAVSQLIKGLRSSYSVMTSIKSMEGKLIAVEMSVSMIRQDDNKNMRVVGSFSSMEDRQKAEWALMEAERKYRTIWENAAAGIYQMTTEGKLISANPAIARIFGFVNADAMMRDIKNAHHDLYVQPSERLRILKSLTPEDAHEMFEFQAYRQDGQKIWVQEMIRRAEDEHGNLMYYEGSLEDVTNRKNAEMQLQEAKRESDMANRAKSEFLSNMSHELRTPLNSIIGFSEIIRNQVLGPIEPASYWEYARDIHESGRHLLSIINQILDISKIETGNRDLREGIVDMAKVIQAVVELSLPKIKDSKLLLVDINYNKFPKIWGEELAIRQMVTNILSNAIKFTEEGGRISIHTDYDDAGDFLFSITDTGIGLDEHELSRMTSKFGVLDGRLSKSTSGIGLGLSLVQSLMHLHGGRLEIISQKGIGTTVTMVFPKSRIQ